MAPGAGESAVKRLLPTYLYFHFAGHSSSVPLDGLASSLVLAPPAKGVSVGRDDGFLEAREALEIPLCLEMVVLSGCSTSRGRYGEALIGLEWADRAAGARSVVGYYWPLQDRASCKLMKRL